MTNAASIGRETAHAIFVTRGANWLCRPFRLGADVIFSAIGLIATVEIWSRWKNEILQSLSTRTALHARPRSQVAGKALAGRIGLIDTGRSKRPANQASPRGPICSHRNGDTGVPIAGRECVF